MFLNCDLVNSINRCLRIAIIKTEWFLVYSMILNHHNFCDKTNFPWNARAFHRLKISRWGRVVGRWEFRQFQSLRPLLVVVSVFLHRDFLAPAVLQIVVDATAFSDAVHLESIPHLIPIQNRFPAFKKNSYNQKKKSHKDKGMLCLLW